MRMRIISDLELVTAIAEAGSLRRAGERLDLAQSNVSRRLRRLEQRLGAPLFRRAGGGASPTEAGAAYLEHATAALREVARAERAAIAAGGRLEGQLSVAAPLAIGRRFVAPVAARFAAAHPDVALDLRLSDRLADPTRHDLVIRAGPADSDALTGRVLTRSELVLVAAPCVAARFAMKTDPAQIAKGPVIGVEDYKPRLSWPFVHRSGEKITVRATPHHVVSDVEAAVDLCLAGLGATLLPDWLVWRELRQGALLRLCAEWRGPAYDIRALTASPRPLPAKSRAFFDALIAAAVWFEDQTTDAPGRS